jgi:hypothetical protein
LTFSCRGDIFGFTVFVVPDACRLKDVHPAFSFLQENPSRNANSFGVIAGILPVFPAAESHSTALLGCIEFEHLRLLSTNTLDMPTVLSA